MIKKFKNFLEKDYLNITFLISFVSVIGSLYFSDILLIEPCYLCWWQRIFMYPIFILTTIALIFRIHIQKIFILALSFGGLIFAIYHYLMQTFGLFKEISSCSVTKPCDAVDIIYFGFITIPFLSLLSFTIIFLVILFSVKKDKYRSFLKK